MTDRWRDAQVPEVVAGQGIGLFVFGCGSLLTIIALAAVVLWPDPNPNPIGPGLLAFLTFWPSMIWIAMGIGQVHRTDRGSETR